MKYESFKGKFKKNNLISIVTKYYKFDTCLIVKIKKDTVHLLPLSIIDDDACAFPCLAFTYNLIDSVNLLDDSKLFFFSNIDNPHIKNAIIKFSEKRKSQNAQLQLSM
jgi:hypothetical protein